MTRDELVEMIAEAMRNGADFGLTDEAEAALQAIEDAELEIVVRVLDKAPWDAIKADHDITKDDRFKPALRAIMNASRVK